MAHAAPNYSRIALPADAPPDEPEVPEFVIQEAEQEIAANLIEAGEVDDLVSVVVGAKDLVVWLANQQIPHYLLEDFRHLDRKARSLAQSRDEIVEREQKARDDDDAEMRDFYRYGDAA